MGDLGVPTHFHLFRFDRGLSQDNAVIGARVGDSRVFFESVGRTAFAVKGNGCVIVDGRFGRLFQCIWTGFRRNQFTGGLHSNFRSLLCFGNEDSFVVKGA